MTSNDRTKRVVIVDDSKMARTVVRRCLEIAGGRDWVFAEAGDGELALKELLRPGDLLVTDLNMPRVDGYELIRRVRADQRLSGMPIIVVSADTDPATPRRIAALGVEAFFPKPFSPALVRRKLEQILNGSTH